MQVEVTFLTRRGTAVIRRSHTVTAESVRFGRGTDNEVPLADIRVELAAAVLRQRPDGLFIERLGDSPLYVNSETTGARLVDSGDEILIGPYKIIVTKPLEGLDAALSVELVQPIGDSLERLITENRIGLDQTGLSKRRVSWALFAILTILGLAAPIALYSSWDSADRGVPGVPTFLGIAWNPGEISNPHRYFAQKCATCHQGVFIMVKDAACLTCHGGIGNHIASAAAVGGNQLRRHLQTTRCAECHEEHRGLHSLVIREGTLCVNCHRSLAKAMPTAGPRDVRGFPVGHPQFRVTVVRDAGARNFERVHLGSYPTPADHPNLVFSHAAHLVSGGFPALGYKPMVCSDCHVPEPSGQGFLAITYKGQCQSCHALKFDATLPWKEVPHGDDARVEADVAGFYASLALGEGGPKRPAPEVERRLPGDLSTPPSEAPSRRAWVRQKTAQALGIIFDEKRGCFYCHFTDSTRGEFRVAPVVMLTRFLLPARFDHAKHTPMQCSDCHDSKHSQSSSDVLVPGIERCITCHGTESASYKAQSTCTSCHVFHRQELEPMRQIDEVEK
jgi:Cytochrome c3/Cytochrome c7 and related cytochrome c